nr:MAG TPA: hypothetical protein [Caudoviricetes sp.]
MNLILNKDAFFVVKLNFSLIWRGQRGLEWANLGKLYRRKKTGDKRSINGYLEG